MREIVVEEDAVKVAERRGWLQYKVQFLGVRGAPDRWFFKGGRLLIVEFKRPGGPVSASQNRRRRELAAAGWVVHIVDTLAAFVALLDQAEASIAGA